MNDSADTTEPPFRTALLSQDLKRLRDFSYELSAQTESTYVDCARIIAEARYAESYEDKRILGKVSEAALLEIKRQVRLFASASRADRPTLEQMRQSVLAARQSSDIVGASVRANLLLRAHDGTELFFAILKAKPTKKECLQAIERVLLFYLLSSVSEKPAQGYIALMYNPYGASRQDYNGATLQKYTPFDESVLIGQEFWEVVGDANAYEELLTIYHEVGHAMSKKVIDILVWGMW